MPAIAQHYDIPDHSWTAQDQEILRQVLVDVPRTVPDVPLFRNDNIRKRLLESSQLFLQPAEELVLCPTFLDC